jgi:hypothetical protein
MAKGMKEMGRIERKEDFENRENRKREQACHAPPASSQ